ncbi:hypothetical protein Hanom_Chr01g00086301 [Helianthus anomalus]
MFDKFFICVDICLIHSLFVSEVYDIDYRGPETHSHRPPPNRAGNDVPHSNIKKHLRFKRRATRNAIKKGGKA